MKKILVFLNLILVFTACTTNKQNQETDAKSETTQEAVANTETLITLRENTLDDMENVVLINDAESYFKITARLNMIRKPGIDFKEIDFTKHSLLVINTEMRDPNSTDYEVAPSYTNDKVSIEFKGLNNPDFEGINPAIRLVKLIVINKTSSLDQMTFTP